MNLYIFMVQCNSVLYIVYINKGKNKILKVQKVNLMHTSKLDLYKMKVNIYPEKKTNFIYKVKVNIYPEKQILYTMKYFKVMVSIFHLVNYVICTVNCLFYVEFLYSYTFTLIFYFLYLLCLTILYYYECIVFYYDKLY